LWDFLYEKAPAERFQFFVKKKSKKNFHQKKKPQKMTTVYVTVCDRVCARVCGRMFSGFSPFSGCFCYKNFLNMGQIFEFFS